MSIPKTPTQTLKKYAGDSLQYTFDWEGAVPDILTYDIILPAGITELARGKAGFQVTVQLSGGTARSWYQIECVVTTALGNRTSQFLSLYVQPAEPENPLASTTLTKYTTYDQVRAILSVTDNELEDQTLAQPVFEYDLLEALDAIAPDVSQTFLALRDTPNLTKQQQRFVDRVEVFSGYTVAVLMLNTLPLLAIMSEQDARAKYERFKVAFDHVEVAVRAAHAVAKSRLTEAYNGLGGTQLATAMRTYRRSGLGTLATDPVTNEAR